MTTIALEKASQHLPELINRARAGEEIVITRGNEAVARLVGVVAENLPRKAGALKGKINLPDSFFFDPLSEEEVKRWWGDGEGGK